MKKTKQLKRLLAVLVFALFTLPLSAQVGVVEEEINAVTAQFQAAYNRGDDAALAGFFTSDAVRINTDGTTVNGAERIKQTYRSGFVMSNLQATYAVTAVAIVSPTEVSVNGNFSINGSIRSNNEEVFSDGVYENTYLKVNGVWKISRMQLRDNQ